jgi:hypothetical protein
MRPFDDRSIPNIVEVHISEVNSASQHDAISHGAKLAFQQIAGLIPTAVPIIVESRVQASQIVEEAKQAIEALIPVDVEQLV